MIIANPKPTSAKPAAAKPKFKSPKNNIIKNKANAMKQTKAIIFSKFTTRLTLENSISNPSRLSIGLPRFLSNFNLILREEFVEFAPNNSITELKA